MFSFCSNQIFRSLQPDPLDVRPPPTLSLAPVTEALTDLSRIETIDVRRPDAGNKKSAPEDAFLSSRTLAVQLDACSTLPSLAFSPNWVATTRSMPRIVLTEILLGTITRPSAIGTNQTSRSRLSRMYSVDLVPSR